MNLDPIVALAGAAAKSGNRMFAADMLNASGATVSVALYQSHDATLVGMDDVTTAMTIDDRIQNNRSALK